MKEVHQLPSRLTAHGYCMRVLSRESLVKELSKLFDPDRMAHIELDIIY